MPYPLPKHIFVIGLNGGAKVFLPEAPREGKKATRWILADAAVALVDCPACSAKTLQPCINTQSGQVWESGTHYRRRTAARGKLPTVNTRIAYTDRELPEGDEK